MIKTAYLIFYYSFAGHLPASAGFLKKISAVTRRSARQLIFKKPGNDINIEKNAYFGSGRDIKIGDQSGIGKNRSLHGPIIIGNYSMTSPEVLMLPRNHVFSRTDNPKCHQGGIEANTIIREDDVWIGARSIILPGIKIGKGVIVAAGSIITRNVERYSIVDGHLVKLIRKRIAGTPSCV